MRKQMKKMATFALVAGLSVISATTAFAGQWKQDETGWWWQEDNGSYPTNSWKEINGKWYYFDGVGYMLENTTTPDGYKVGADGAWIVEESSTSDIEEILSVVDEKALPYGTFYLGTTGNLIPFSESYGKYSFYNRNFDKVYTLPSSINGYAVTDVQRHIDGVSVVKTASEYGYSTNYCYLYDETGNRIYDLNIVTQIFRFEPGQDPNGVTLFAWTNYTDAIRFTSYSSQNGLIEKTYYYKDYPELERVNYFIGFENGKANLVCREVDRVENQGYLNQKTYYNSENIMTVDTLCNLSGKIDLMSRGNTANTSFSIGDSKSTFGNTGAYFEPEGTMAVLRDANGNEKFRTETWGFFSWDSFVKIVDENRFLAAQEDANGNSSMHLYRINYK